MGYLFLIPSLILFLVFVAYPVLNTLKTSFYSLRVQNIATGGKWVGLANYKKYCLMGICGSHCVLLCFHTDFRGA